MSVYDLVKLPEDTEYTGQPFWFIAQNGPRGLYMLKGIWFSRNAAEAHLKSHAHGYPKSAFIYCASGMETDIENLRELANGDLTQELLEALEAWKAFWDDMPKGQMGKLALGVGLLNDAFVKMSRALASAQALKEQAR